MATDASFFLSTSVPVGTEDANASTGSAAVTDNVGNSTTAGPITWNMVDKKAPTDISFIGGIADGETYYFGFVPAAPTCTATDGGSGFASCVVTGYSTAVGSHTLTATAKDNVDNTSTATLSYTVSAWTLNGFYQPVDMGNVWNTVNSGSTVPLKFETFAGPAELTDVAYIKLMHPRLLRVLHYQAHPKMLSKLSLQPAALSCGTIGPQASSSSTGRHQRTRQELVTRSP